MNTAEKGCLTEAILVVELLKRSFPVLKPVHAHARYDLVIETAGIFVRLQCKTGRLRGGRVEFNTCSSAGSRKATERFQYHGDADEFLVYCPDNQKVYRVPVNCVGKTEAALRIEPSKNGQQKNVLWARDFEF